MKAELLEKLLDAGFNKTEIINLVRDEPEKELQKEPEAQKEPQKEPEKEPEAQKEPQKEPEKEPEANQVETRLSKLENSITDLIKSIQSQNLKHDRIEHTSETLEDETDKIMRSIIRPEIKKKEG